jgi:TonB-dependent SusC/RagA subfamily outer membrane receptor
MKWNKILVLVLLICLSPVSFGQKANKGSDKPVTITGKVVSLNQSPVVGAVLYIDNVRTSTITRDDGTYKIKVSPSAVTLEVRSSQYGNCETPINGKTEIYFTLDGAEGKASSSLDKAKDPVSGENSYKTRGSRAKKMNTYNDIYQMIRAEVTGVTVSGRSIQIKQGHSFIGSGEPLYVLNGVVVPSIDQVNPVEVKSIKVLKGSEAAIYGVRGSNGVITITLKDGSEKEE